MAITHVVRGAEYLSSTPKYNLLYEAFGWDIPTYVHLPAVMKDAHNKLSKRNGDASFQDLIEKGYLPDAIVNYIALLGWSPSVNQEIFTIDELIKCFDIKGLSKSPAIFDIVKLTWMNGEYIKKLTEDEFYEMAEPYIKKAVKREGIDLKKIAGYIHTRIGTLNDIAEMLDFVDELPDYSTELYIHKKMKTTEENSRENLEKVLPVIENITEWTNERIYGDMVDLIKELGIKNGQMFWPVRTALSGKPTSPCGASELAELLGKEETIARIKKGIEMLTK
jgi:glutamyl-tRNA synthetase